VAADSKDLQLLEADAEESDDPSISLELGQTYLGLGRYSEAERWIRRAQRLDPERVEIRTKLGILAFRRGLYVQAEADLLWACEHDSQDSIAFLYRGEALNQLGKIDEAIEAVEASLRLNPEHSRSHYLMGILLDRKNRHQEASLMYRRARELASR
jgi:tetratricopeptide (TPR) repeat protein